ncbi:CBS domain-containing protein [Cuneatibacter sp. NSJ-177]|uniref:CBS domain-containing protein n=1 Tax=Cuneatibacter sp. NSJ-177 TaxID=2931401 RepID=UPI001FD29432|nr:CBS domain-containing protein [Cuneatibacter sp. NSJ-177]
MNILFFLTPKSDVAYLTDEMTLRQALEKMEHHRYTCIPMLDRNGRYVGTVTEGDLLWAVKNQYDLSVKNAEEVPILDVKRRRDYEPVNINAKIEDMVFLAMGQNFVPVVDDRGAFIGIVTRKDIMRYCYDEYIVKRNEKTTEN